MDDPIASIIIPTRNRPQAIELCLDALAAQTLPSGSFEVIVVDDGGEPALALDPARWASKFELKLIRQNNTGPAGARNRGVSEARGEFLAFTDDDCLPTPTWLEKLVAALRANPEAMVGGSTFNGLKDDLFAETSQLIVQLVYDHFNRDSANAYFLLATTWPCGGRTLSNLGGSIPRFASLPRIGNCVTVGECGGDRSFGKETPQSNIAMPKPWRAFADSTSATDRGLSNTKPKGKRENPAG